MPLDLKTLEESPHLLDVLIQCEDVLDTLDLYVWQNWISGQIVEGPVIKRHWVKVGLLYPYRKMPDPRAALRLMKHGIKIEFKKMRRQEDKHNPIEKSKKHEDHEKNIFWLIELKFPRRLLKKISDDLEEYEDDVDIDDIEQAKDDGIDNETAFQDGEQAGDFTDPSQNDLPPQPGGF